MKLLAICLLVSMAYAAMQHHSTVTPGWKKVQTGVDDDHVLSLTVALKQQNTDVLENKFWDVSDPLSKNYRKFMSFDQVKELVAPKVENVKTVRDYFTSHGVENSLHISGDFLHLKATAAQAREMFGTTYDVYHHQTTGRKMVRSRQPYVLHPTIREHIDFISGERLPNLNSKYDAQRSIPTISTQKRQQTFSGPQTIYINPLDRAMLVTFVPTCADGSTTTSLNLCSDHPPVIANYTITVVQGEGYSYGSSGQVQSTYQVTSGNCKIPSGNVPAAVSAFYAANGLSNGTVYCTFPIYGLKNYEAMSISIGASSINTIVANDFAQVELGEYVTPQLIWELYNVPKGIYGTNPNSSQAVAEFLGQFYSPQDLSNFFVLNGLNDFSSSVNVVGPNDPSNPGGEASLDIQYIMGVAQNISTTFWSLGNLHDGQEPFLDWIVQVLNTPNPPLVHSVSYGDDESSLTPTWMQRVNVEFQKAGAIGLSLLFSSGDTGVFGQNPTCTGFVPSFPASSPYVTAVGATLLSTRTSPICFNDITPPANFPIKCDRVGEVASTVTLGSRITSGGGFSNVFSTPPYQQTPQVQNYVKNLANISRPFNSNGRVYPDVSALGHNFLVLLGGEIVPVDGTSAAAPTFAGVVSLLNDYLMNKGQPALGFLNPLIYNMAGNATGAFNDITVGDNSCSELAWNCCPNGFAAAVGFDAVTGLGSPNYLEMRNYLTNNYPMFRTEENSSFMSTLWNFVSL